MLSEYNSIIKSRSKEVLAAHPSPGIRLTSFIKTGGHFLLALGNVGGF